MPDRFHDSVVGRHAAPRPSDAHERAAAAKKLGDFVRSSGDRGGGGSFSTRWYDVPAGMMPYRPVTEAKPLSLELRDAMEKWGQGSGVIDPTRTGTDPELVGRLQGQFEPSPWEGDVRWHDFFTGKGLFGEKGPENAFYGGKFLGPGGGPPISVGQAADQGSLKDQMLGLVKSFDPRKGESFLNYAGLFGGPRRVSPHVVRMKLQGVLDDHPVSTEMGFGHAESEWPSVVGGVTLHRVQAVHPRSDRSPFYNPPEWKTHTLSDAGSLNPYFVERGRRSAGTSDPSRRGMELAYNWVDDQTKEILGSIEMRVHPDHSYTGWIHFKKDDPRSAFFATDSHRIHQGIGKVARAHIASTSESRAGTNWAQVMATAGTVHPVYSWFTQKYGRLKDLEMTDLVGIGHENYGLNDPNPTPVAPPAPTYPHPSPTPFPPRPHGSNLPGDEWQPGPGSGSYEPGTFGYLSNLISRRLDTDGHMNVVDEIHNANLASPRDRVLHYLTWMRNSGHYTPRQIAYYRGQLTRIGYQERPRTPTETARAMFTRLEQDNWGREAREIHANVRVEDQISDLLQFMRDADYHPEVIRYFEDMVPEGTLPVRAAPRTAMSPPDRENLAAELYGLVANHFPHDARSIGNAWPDSINTRIRSYLDVMRANPTRYTPRQIQDFEERLPDLYPRTRQAPARSTAALDRAASEAESAMADWLITHGYVSEQIRIFNQHDNNAARARAYFQIIHRDPHVDATTLQRFREMRPNLGRRSPGSRGARMTPLELTAWTGAINRAQTHLREQGFDVEVAEINRGNPLRGEGAYARRFQAYLSLMRSLNFSPQEIAEFAARAPAGSAGRPMSYSERWDPQGAQAAARAHLEQQRAHHANEQRQREIEEEMDSIGHYPDEGSAAYQRYQQLGEEWSRLQGESDPIDPVPPSTYSQGQFNQRIGASGQRLAPQGQPGWENAAAHLAIRLSEDGHGASAMNLTAGMDVENRVSTYLFLMERLNYPSDVIHSYENLVPGDASMLRHSESDLPTGEGFEPQLNEEPF